MCMYACMCCVLCVYGINFVTYHGRGTIDLIPRCRQTGRSGCSCRVCVLVLFSLKLRNFWSFGSLFCVNFDSWQSEWSQNNVRVDRRGHLTLHECSYDESRHLSSSTPTVWGHVGTRMTEGSKDKKTLFVRNLPYTTTDAELEKAFGHYGQINSCFTVKEKGKHLPRTLPAHVPQLVRRILYVA